MLRFIIQYDLRAEIQQAVLEIRTSNDYNDAYGNWKAEHDQLDALRKSGILNNGTYKTYSNMLDWTIAD